MTETCAVCGERPMTIDRNMPVGWTDYLCEEHGLNRPIHGYRISVCEECYGTVDVLRQEYIGGGDPHGDEEVTDLLDGLVLENLTDESPYDGESA